MKPDANRKKKILVRFPAYIFPNYDMIPDEYGPCDMILVLLTGYLHLLTGYLTVFERKSVLSRGKEICFLSKVN
jgi:hypothetical protein